MPYLKTWAAPLALPILLTAAAADAAADERARSIAWEDGRLVAPLADGTRRSGEALGGMEVPIGEGETLRIEAVFPDPHAHASPSLLYEVAIRTGQDRYFEKLCAPDPYGETTAFAVPGHFEEDGAFVRAEGGRFSFACTAGARGKCIRFGYPPWESTAEGVDLAPYHAACVRMTRADYCGDGRPHTVAGVAIQIVDRIGVNPPAEPPYGAFEAAWGKDGALCLARPRRPEFSLNQILAACPRLAEVPAEQCDAAALGTLPGALLANRS